MSAARGGAVVLAAAILVLTDGQNPRPCGRFKFTSKVHADAKNVLIANISFDYRPARCGAARTMTADKPGQITFVQVIRAWDTITGYPVYWNSEVAHWAANIPKDVLHDAWGVDNDYTGALPYFHYVGGPPPHGMVPFGAGQSGVPAEMIDTPTGKADIVFQALAAPVCTEAPHHCNGRVLGYLFWEFKLDNTGTATLVDEGPFATQYVQPMVDAASNQWNVYVASPANLALPTGPPKFQKVRFPTLTPLP